MNKCNTANWDAFKCDSKEAGLSTCSVFPRSLAEIIITVTILSNVAFPKTFTGAMWRPTTFSLLKYEGKSLDMIAAYCRRTLFMVWRGGKKKVLHFKLELWVSFSEAPARNPTFAKRHMKWARACGFGHSSFLMISKLWFSWVNTSTTEQEKRACSEVCWNCRREERKRKGKWARERRRTSALTP